MISMDVLLKQMKKWTANEKEARLLFKCIYFEGSQAMASDTHCLAIVKDWKSQKGYILSDGRFMTVEDMAKETGLSIEYPDTSCHIKQTRKDWDWCAVMDKDAIDDMTSFIAYADKLGKRMARKNHKNAAAGIFLTINGNDMPIYCIGNNVRIKSSFQVNFLQGAPNDKMSCVDAERVKNAMDFITATKSEYCYIGTAKGTFHFETDDLHLIIAGLRPMEFQEYYASSEDMLERLINFVWADRNLSQDMARNAQEAADAIFDA